MQKKVKKKRLLKQTHNNITRPSGKQVKQGQYIRLHRYLVKYGFWSILVQVNCHVTDHWQSVNENRLGIRSARQSTFRI